MLTFKWHTNQNQLASELLSYRRQSSWQWQTVSAGHKSARYIKRAVMQYQRECPFDTVNVRFMDDGEASIVIQRSTQMDRLVRPSELDHGDYYWKGIENILRDFNSQVTSSAAQASYKDISIECDSLLTNEVTKQLFKSGWLSTVHDPGNGMVTIVVNVHESILKQRWEDMG
jgi:thymidylate synthase ThyX